MNTALQIKEALVTLEASLRAYQDVPVGELIEADELQTYYKLVGDKCLLLKALSTFGDFMARRECQRKADKAAYALKWLRNMPV